MFGGWAEELLGLSAPRSHRDIDLVVEDKSFAAIDGLFRSGRLANEIVLKRFHHKRAFVFNDTMIEIYRVEPCGDRLVTLFWGDAEHVWLKPLTTKAWLDGHCVNVITPENLSAFRRARRSHQPWRWRDRASLISPV